MSQGLPVSRLISVEVDLAPQGAAFQNFDTLLIVGETDVIDVGERIRGYSSIEDVGVDFGTTDPEYKAALLFFSQVPQPSNLYIGRWAHSATHGLLLCGILTATQQLMSAWTSITNGSFHINIDGGGLTSITGLDFHLQSNLDGVASVITAALTGATCVWTGAGASFEFISSSTGATSTIAALTDGASGTNIAAQLKGKTGEYQRIVNGIAAETALAAVQALDSLRTRWYGLMFAAPDIMDSDHQAIAGYVEAAANRHIYGITVEDTNAESSSATSDIGYVIQQLGYMRTFGQFTSTTDDAVASMFGREFTVNFEGENTTITLMYKTEPGVVAESLTTAEANALDTKRYNYYADFNNGVAIIVNGTMFGPAYIDEIHGLDWLANAVQTNVFNALFTTPTKIPQDDSGNHILATAIEAACAQGVTNGLIAPGTWNSAGFGQLKQGQFLNLGYYVYAPPIVNQPQNDRTQRKSVAFQVAVKLAGAVHTVDALIIVNR